VSSRRVAAAERRLGAVPNPAAQAEFLVVIEEHLAEVAAGPMTLRQAFEEATLLAAAICRASGLAVFDQAVARLSASSEMDPTDVATYRDRIAAQTGRFDLL